VIWRATRRRGRASRTNGRDRSAPLHQHHLVAAIIRLRAIYLGPSSSRVVALASNVTGRRSNDRTSDVLVWMSWPGFVGMPSRIWPVLAAIAHRADCGSQHWYILPRPLPGVCASSGLRATSCLAMLYNGGGQKAQLRCKPQRPRRALLPFPRMRRQIRWVARTPLLRRLYHCVPVATGSSATQPFNRRSRLTVMALKTGNALSKSRSSPWQKKV